MSLAGLMVHDVVIQTAGSATDRYGNATKVWGTATSVTAKGWVSQRPGDEDLLNRDAQLAEWVLFLPVGTAITGYDRVTWGSLTFEVVGPPQRAWTPRGEHHVEASLRYLSG